MCITDSIKIELLQKIIFRALLRHGAGTMRHAIAAPPLDKLTRAADNLTRAAEKVDTRRPQADACRIARAKCAHQLTQALSHEVGFRF